MRKIKRLVATLAIMCVVLVSNKGIVALAAPENTNNVQEVELKINEANAAVARTSYHTFYQIPNGRYTGGLSLDFSIDKACRVKLMVASKYTDGSSGTLTYIVQNLYGIEYAEGTMPMDGSTHNVLLENKIWPAGTYNIIISANNPSKEFVVAGEVYTLEY